MLDTDLLKGVIAFKGLSQRKIAFMLGITDRTFYEKMKKKDFLLTEIESMIEILEINDPVKIFFAPKCSLKSDKA